MHSFIPPDLATFNQRPSWCNLHGTIDRSACLEVRLSEARKLAGCVHPAVGGAPHTVLPLPNERPAPNNAGRAATGVFAITARQLHELNRTRMPRQLAGDLRTLRAHAMRDDEELQHDATRRFHFRQARNADPIDIPFDVGLAPNPNHGASRTKMIGLPETWAQPLRIEKWIFEKRIQPAYYLICPGQRNGSGTSVSAFGSGSLLPRDEGPGARVFTSSPSSTQLRASSAPFAISAVHSPPPLSTCKRGRNSARKGCPQRTLKLMMVQCTEAELIDARVAQLWIDSLPPEVVPRNRHHITQLLDRYATIMQPRVLLCPRCLGVRYGNNPENARQSWRRKVGKDNARPAKRTVVKGNNAKWARATKRTRKR